MASVPKDYWGKYRSDASGGGEWLSLLDHLVDVATTLQVILQSNLFHNQTSVRGIGLLNRSQIDRLCYLAMLHDLGKCHTEFQSQIWPGQPQRRHRGHTKVCCYFLLEDNFEPDCETFSGQLPESAAQWFTSNDEDSLVSFARVLLATWGHHGTPIDYQLDKGDTSLRTVKWSQWEYTDFAAILTRINDRAHRHWPLMNEANEPINASAEFLQEFNGLLQLADWVASDTRWFSYKTPSIYSCRFDFARENAMKFLAHVGRSSHPKPGLSFESIFTFKGNPMQNAFNSFIAGTFCLAQGH